MDTDLLSRFRSALTLHRDRLTAWVRQQMTGTPFPLGDPSLTSCDGNDLDVLAELDHTLDCIERGEFGRCERCGGAVEVERLEQDFTTCVCLDHYSEAQIRALERDLELAARVQQHLFPCCVPAVPGLEIAAHARPGHIVSGDYYDFFCHRDHGQGVVIADVMGQGLPASMLMANLQAALRILGPEYDEPHALVTRLNELFRYNLKLIRFISLFALTIDVDRSRIRYSNAGHHPPVHWIARTETTQWLRPTGPALGLMHAPPFTSETLAFHSGDVLVLYTDGLVEARNARGEEFGEDRLVAYVAQHHAASAEDLLSGLVRAAERFTDGALHDDVTLLVIKQHEAPSVRLAETERPS